MGSGSGLGLGFGLGLGPRGHLLRVHDRLVGDDVHGLLARDGVPRGGDRILRAVVDAREEREGHVHVLLHLRRLHTHPVRVARVHRDDAHAARLVRGKVRVKVRVKG